ncbi:hypothetical protein XBJ2_930006 [Xenorhabdus bovienii str. Jollieti]|uniref:Uncharacterized protein n=1 Tax=Xenorhabdus bovienii (strain SS-2004) TaxID=406818 RepID=D3V2M1_XENBS|nr:hypothetical protein XBJ1_1860 [Xenorhabdus bovienii SS-2004]CDH30674.1 hypothetical protein XBJ2_930006 [Xenorhabdus bovienii str. Jollieti]
MPVSSGKTVRHRLNRGGSREGDIRGFITWEQHYSFHKHESLPV